MADSIKKPGFFVRTFLHSSFLRHSGLAAATALAPKSAKYTNLEMFQQMSPKISETEQQALNSGTVGKILSGFYEGQVDWKALHAEEHEGLTAEEQAFINGPAQELCKMIDEHQLLDSKEKDLPPHVWQFIKDKGFLGMGIPKEYGGLEFSEAAHSAVLKKIGSRSFSGSVDVMVPNSLGLAKSIMERGTQEQKDKWLPQLARGMISAFGLTELYAGSDATAIKTTAIVKRDDSGKPYLHIENNGKSDAMLKRFITLAPLLAHEKGAIGMAVQVKDPENILGKGKKPGITLVLVESENPGLSVGRRHDPLGAAFPNGTVYSKPGGIKISIDDNVIGGLDQIGQGWPALVSQLNKGRGVSLPSVAEAGMELSCLAAGDYAVAREQFGSEIGAMEENKKHLGEMAAITYMSKSMRSSTLRNIDAGGRPAVEGAIAKYFMVENLVAVATEATQIMGGKSIMQGPKNPLIEKILQWAQIARTVEGARNLGHGMIIPGQGMVRVHPQILDEIAASQKESKREAAGALWEIMMGKHLPNLLNNLDEARSRGRNNGEGSPAVTKDENLVKYYEQYNRLSSAFNVVANVALVTVGGALKFKEALGSHLGDVLIHAYAVGTALEDFERRGCPEAERPMLELGCEMYLEKMEEGMHEFIRNYRDQMPGMIAVVEKTMLPNMNKMLEAKIKNKAAASFLGNAIGGLIKKVFNYMPEFLTKEVFPEGRTIEKPLDSLKLTVGDILLNPGPARDYLVGGIYIPGADEPENPIRQLEEAFEAKTAVRSLAAKVGRAIRKGEIANPYEAVTKGILTQEEGEQLLAAQAAAEKAVMVDDYPAEMFRPTAPAPAPTPPG